MMNDPREQYLIALQFMRPILVRLTHDLNNSLVGVMGYAQLLQRQSLEPESARRFLDVIYSQSVNCQKTLSNLEGALETLKPTMSEVDIGQVVRGYLALRTAGDTTGDVALNLECAEALPKRQADPTFVHRALEALIRNGIQATASANHSHPVDIRVTCEGEVVVVAVLDRGVGLPENVEIHTLFDPAVTFRRSRSGLGLGLIQALQRMRALGGDVQLAHREDGEGTCAKLLFPLGS